MTCPYCGKNIEDNSIICIFCEKFIKPTTADTEQQSVDEKVDMENTADTNTDHAAPFAPDPYLRTSPPQYMPPIRPRQIPSPISQKPDYDPPLSVSAYAATILISLIPIIGLIILIIWACSSFVNMNRRRLSTALILFKTMILFFAAGAMLALVLINNYSFYFLW